MAASVTISLLLRDNVSRRMGRVNDQFRRLSREMDITQRNSSALGQTMKTFQKTFAKPFLAVGALTGALNALASVASITAAAAVQLGSSLGPALAASVGGLVGIFGALAQGMLVFKLATKGVGAALGGNKKAFDKLTPTAKKFVTALRELAPAFQKLREHIQSKLFAGLDTQIKKTATQYLPLMRKAFGDTATVFNKFAKAFLKMAQTKEWKSDFTKITGNNNKVLGHLGKVALSMARIFKDLWVTMGPLIERFAKWLEKSAKAVENMVHANRESGKLGAFFKRAGDRAAQWGRILGDLATALFNVFKIGQDTGQSLTDTIEKASKKFKDWTKTAEGENKISRWFQDANEKGKQLWGLIGDLGKAFKKAFPTDPGSGGLGALAGAGKSGGAGSFIAKIRAEWIPAINDLMAAFAKGDVVEDLIGFVGKWLNIMSEIAKSGALQTVVQGLNLLADSVKWLMDNVPGVTGIMQAFFGAMLALTVLNFLGLTGAISALVGALWSLGTAMGIFMTASGGFSARMAAISASARIGTVLSAAAAAMAFLTSGTVIATVSFWAMTVASAALTAALAILTSPITWIIVAIVALVAAVVWAYKNVGWFRTAVDAAWDGIKVAFSAAWSAIQVVLKALWVGIKWVGGVLMWLWTNIVQPVWNWIVAFWKARGGEILDVMKVVWNGIKSAAIAAWPVIKAIFSGIWSAVKVVGGWMLWLWHNAVVPAWGGISGWIGQHSGPIKAILGGIWGAIKVVGGWMVWLWKTVIVPAWSAISATVTTKWGPIKAIFNAVWGAIKVVGGWMMWLWKTIINPVWNGISAAIQDAWDGHSIKPIFDAIIALLKVVGTWMVWFWKTVIVPVWNGISSFISAHWITIKTIFNVIVSTIRTLGTIFSWLWHSAVGPAWNGIKLVIAVAWVAIRAIFNSIKAFINGPLKLAWTAIRPYVVAAWNGVRAAISLAWTAIKVIFVAIRAFINGPLRAAWNSIRPIVTTAWNGVRAAITTAWNLIKVIFNAIKSFINGPLKAAWNGIRPIVTSVWNSVRTTIQGAWTKIKVIFAAIKTFIDGPLKTAWNGIKTIVTSVWNSVRSTISGAWGKIKTIFGAIKSFIDGPLKTAWNAIKTIVQQVWDAIKKKITDSWNAIKRIWDAIVSFLKGPFTTAWNNLKSLLNTVWTAIQKTISDNWNKIKAIWALIATGINTLKTKFTELKTKLTEIWNAIKKTIADAWNSIKSNTFDKMIAFVKNDIPKAFDACKAGIKRVWDGIKKVFADPINFVMGTVWGGLASFIERSLKIFGITKKLPRFNKVAISGAGVSATAGAFADGGVLPGYSPGRDNMVATSSRGPVHLSGGEAIMRPEWTRAIGTDKIHAMNAVARNKGVTGLKRSMGDGGFANGGVFSGGSYASGGVFPGGSFDLGGVFGAVGDAASKAWNIAKDPMEAIKATKDKIMKNGIGYLWEKSGGRVIEQQVEQLLSGGGFAGTLAGGAMRTVIKAGVNWAMSLIAEKVGSAGGGVTYANASERLKKGLAYAQSQFGKPYQWGGGGNPSFDCSGFMAAIQRVIQGQSPGRLYTTHDFNGGSAPAGWVQNLSSPFEVGVSHQGVGHMAGTLLGVNVESSGSGGVHGGAGVRRGAHDPYFSLHYGYKPVVGDAKAAGSTGAMGGADTGKAAGSSGGTKKGGDAAFDAKPSSKAWFGKVVTTAAPAGGAAGGVVGAPNGAGACYYTSFGGPGEVQPTASGVRSDRPGVISTNNYPLHTVMDLWGSSGSSRATCLDFGPAAFVQQRHGSMQLIDLGPDIAKKVIGGYGGNGSGKFKVVSMGSGKSYRQLHPAGFANGGIVNGGHASGIGGAVLPTGARERIKGYANGGTMKAGQWAIVGERGPELVMPANDTTVIPNGGVPAATSKFKDVAMKLLSSAENSSLNYNKQYGYIEDIKDGRGYTGGIAGFTSGTNDMLQLVKLYTKMKKSNPLAKFIPALTKVDGSSSHKGLGGYVTAWKKAAKDKVFQNAQDSLRDSLYWNPATSLANGDSLRKLGQFAYFDTAIVHGYDGLKSVRKRAMKKAKTPKQGGTEKNYLTKFFSERATEMRKEEAHSDISRVTMMRKFLKEGKYDLQGDLAWKMYGDPYKMKGFASGGQMAPNEVGVVGEKGPELFFAGKSGGYIMSNNSISLAGKRGSASDHSAGEPIIINFNDKVFVKDEREFKKMVVTAIAQAKRNGEIK